MKSPTTGQWWSEGRRRSGAFVYHTEGELTHCAALFSFTTWHQEKYHFSVDNLKRKCKCCTPEYFLLSQVILYSFYFACMKYSNSTEKLFQSLPFSHRHVFATSRLDSVFFYQSMVNFKLNHGVVRLTCKWKIFPWSHACRKLMFSSVQIKVLLMHNWVLRI